MVVALTLERFVDIKDFHLKNLMISIGVPPTTISEITELEGGPTMIPEAEELDVFTNARTGLEIRIYPSQPLSLKPGELFSVKDIRLKIADFGHGCPEIFYCD
jgi:hypothetical protein